MADDARLHRSNAQVYLDRQLWRVDLPLLRSYALGRAFRTASRHRPDSSRGGRSDFTYGETPLPAIRRILELSQADHKTTLLDLGSGTGRFALFAARILGLDATGVELVAPFVVRGNAIAEGLKMANCRFLETDLFAASWAASSLVYVAATAFCDASRAELTRKCSELAPGARIALTTHAPDNPDVVQEATDVLDFSWGPTAVFVYRRL
jgi:SAM-dependent methyltransferase